jgi:uncharacterized membrane protein
VLLDGSESMSFPAADPQRTRQAVQAEVFAKLQAAVSEEDEQLRLRFIGYSEQARTLSTREASQFVSESAAGTLTDLGGALSAAIADVNDPPLGGIILIGDGAHTATTPGPLAAARSISALQLPLWTVPIGARVTSDQRRDLALLDAPELLRVFAKNQFNIRATLLAQGLAGAVVPVRLRLVNNEGQSSELAARQIAIGSADENQVISLDLTAPPPGSYQLVMEAESQSGELIELNNRQVTFLEVADGGGRVLYIEGQPRQEQLFLRRSLASSPDLQVAFTWIEGTPENWPVDLKMLLDPQTFDVCILGDVDSNALGGSQLEQLAAAVGDGKGLLLVGGLHAFDAGGYAESPLAEVIPVEMDRTRRQRWDAPPRVDAQLPAPVPFVPRVAHPILRLGSDAAEDAARWTEVAPLLGANRLLPAKALPGVQLLAASPTGDPLLVAGEYGAGRVLAFAGDSTWQWFRKSATRDVHLRFWRQAILWLLGRDDQQNTLQIELAKRRFTRQEEISVNVAWRNSGAEAPPALELVPPTGLSQPVALAVVPQSNGMRFTGRLKELAGGIYRLIGRDASGSELASMQFEVVESDPERLRPLADIALLEQLASLTSDAGGKSYLPDAIPELLKQLDEMRNRASQTVVDRKRLGDGPVSGWLLFGGWVMTYSTLWFLRRRWGGA